MVFMGDVNVPPYFENQSGCWGGGGGLTPIFCEMAFYLPEQ